VLSARAGVLTWSIAAIGLAVPALASAGRAAAAPVVSAGPLTAEVAPDPWRLSFADERGRPVLNEHPGRGTGPSGTIGFRVFGVWRHATRVLRTRRDGGAYLARLATTDPSGRQIDLRLRRAGEGVIGLEASLVGSSAGLEGLGIGFEAQGSERYLGFGERSNAVDQRGKTVENYVGEGPYRLEERPFIAPLVPPWGYQPRDDATYFPMPWLLSTSGYGVLVDNTETSYFRLGTERRDAWSLELAKAPLNQAQAAGLPAPRRLSLRVFAGPRPANALRRMTAAVGRQPEPAAPWYFGPWFQPTGDERAEVRKLRAADAPLSVAQTYLHYLPCGEQQGVREKQRERTRFFHSEGLATTTYFNPMVCTAYRSAYERAAREGGLTKTRNGQPYLYRYSTADQFVVGQFDFSGRAGRAGLQRVLGEAVADGYDGWMEDFGEYTPLDSRSADGSDGTAMHNRYPVLYHCAAHDFARRTARPLGRFNRSGFTGAARCSQIVWGGDPTTDWGFDGLASAVKNGLTMGLSGVSTWGSDIGGFFALGNRRLTPELLKRWVQFGAVSGVMRTQAEGIALPPKGRPGIVDAGQLPHWRRYAKLRTQLYPYLVAADAVYRERGLPIMRHLALAYPGDPRASAREDEFLFGPDLLAAPVTRPGARERGVYLPRGRWIDLWRSARYDPAGGGVRIGRAKQLDGGRPVTLPAPLDELPLLVRAGAVLPLLPPDVDTLADTGSARTSNVAGGARRARKTVGLSERDHRLELLAFPRGVSSTRLYRDERISSRETRDGWELRIEGDATRDYRLQASLATLERAIEPCRVTLDGRPLAATAWTYDAKKLALRASFRTRAGQLRVGACSAGEDPPSDSARRIEADSAEESPTDAGDVAAADDASGSSNGALPVTGLGLAGLVLAAAIALSAGILMRSRTRGGRR